MVDRNIIKITEEFVKKRLLGEGTGHDWWHTVRVSSTAKHIQLVEGGDEVVIDLACLLHDVGDRKVIDKENDDYVITENFLKQHNVSDDIITKVMFIIKNMSFSKHLKNKIVGAPIEFQIVQDADRLDAIGAVGIARMFTYGGSKKRPIFDPDLPARDSKTTAEYKQPNASSFHHFDEKLLHIKALLNTDTAMSIAEGRDEYMRQFIGQFLDEWNGKK
jgi:uncharacterized protein